MKLSVSLPSVFSVTCHTDFVGKNSVFVAIEGYSDNGVNYITDAIEKGARTIVVHHDTFLSDELHDCILRHNVVVTRVDNTRKALALLSARAAQYPAKLLKIIGVTGTKGKTTTAFLLEHILRNAGYKTALISSVQNRIDSTIFVAPLTTPQPDYLQQFLKLCVDNAVDYVVMEVAAQALTLHRVEEIMFCGVIFTNFSHEHLEFYHNLDEYFNAKCLIFDQVIDNSPIVINEDNQYCIELFTHRPSAIRFGFSPFCSGYRGELVTDVLPAIALRVHLQDRSYDFTCSALLGTYNAYNILAATSLSLALQIDAQSIAAALQSFTGIPGRLQEHLLSNGARCFIDYAHNPESFTAVLSTLRSLTSHLIVVFGAGGGRDKLKRPLMGCIAASIADIIFITSDNPRLEDPAAIAHDIMQGIPGLLRDKVRQELDRKKAIEYAYQLSDQKSIIVLLGKGPDEYQIIGTTKYYFSERDIVEQL